MIIKRFINKKVQEQIRDVVCDFKFPWFWRDGLINFSHTPNKKGYNKSVRLKYPKQEAPMMMHQVSKYDDIYNEHLFTELIKPFSKIWEQKTKHKIKTIKRTQFNLYPRVSIIPEEHYGSLHRDIHKENKLDESKHFSILYFVIDSDGPTVTYDDDMNEIERCDPIQGRLMYYPSIMLHQPFVPVLNKRRITLQIEVEVY